MNKPIDFSKGLVPVILQHAQTDSVLMLGYMNEEAYQNSERKESNFSSLDLNNVCGLKVKLLVISNTLRVFI